MTRAFSTLGCPEATLEAVVALAQRHNVPAVELRVLEGAMDLPSYWETLYGQPERLAGVIAQVPVKIVALNTSFRLIGHDAADRDALLRWLPWAEALGGTRLRIFDGGRRLDRTECDQVADTVAWWTALRSARGWLSDLMVETHDSLLTTPNLEQFRCLAPELAILWDAHHTWRLGGESPTRTWRAIAGAVAHVHVKDSISRPRENLAYTYVNPGEGEFPQAELMAVLRSGAFDGPVSLEWEKAWHPSLGTLDSALAAAQRRGWW